MKKFFYVFAFALVTTFMLPIMNVKAEGVVDEIRINSSTTSVMEGALGSFVATSDTEHVSGIEAYEDNTSWVKWPSGYSNWNGFGANDPVAVNDGETHYGLRVCVNLESGYEFSDNPTIYFNGVNYTNEGHSQVSKMGFGGYVYIDLGLATADMGEISGASGEVEEISAVSVTIKAPKIGDELKLVDHQDEYGAYQEPSIYPTIVIDSSANYKNDGSYYIKAYPSMSPDDYDEFFVGTFEEGKYYYVEVYLTPKDGYAFSDNVTLTVNGKTDNYELSEWNFSGQLMFYAKIEANNGDDETVEEENKVLAGANQEFVLKSGKQLVFRFDIPFNEFKESGKVYMDGNLVDPKNYTLSEGSTIVTFTDNYSNSLKEGNHTVRLISDNNDVSTDFKVVANPNTGDNVIIYVVLFLFGISGIYLLGKKVYNN